MSGKAKKNAGVPPKDGIVSVKNGVLAIAALFFIFLAIVLEHPSLHLTPPESESVIFRAETLIGLSKEIGFALLIAVAVSIGIESQSRANDERNAEAMRQQIAEDVFCGVFGKSLPPTYVDQVVQTALKTDFIREFYDAEYTLDALTPAEEQALGVEAGRFLSLHVLSKYKIRNVSGKDTRVLLRYAFPTRGGALRDYSEMKRLEIGGKGVTADRMAEMLAASDEGHKLYRWEVPLAAGDATELLIESKMIKERSDNEVFGSYFPTMKFNISLTVNVPELRFGIRDLAATASRKTYDAPDRGVKKWEIDGAMLPNDSVTVWWRTPEDDGQSPAGGTA